MRIAVIGAGVVGLAIAWRLHLDGHEVVVLDPEPVSGASFAAGGMLTPVGEVHHGEEALSALLVDSARRYPGFVELLAAHLPDGAATGYRTGGTIICGSDAADRGHLAELHALSLRLGLATEELTTRAARRLEPLLGPGLSCAFLAPDDHQVDPRVLAAALLTALERASVEFVPDAATAVTAGESPAVTTASSGRVEADLVVVANGTGAGALDGDVGVELAPLLRPVRGEVVRLRAPAHLAALLHHTIRGMVAGRPVYLIPRADGRVLLGASSREDALDGVAAGGVFDLLGDAIRLMPAVREFEVEDVVARARPGTPDNAPLLGSTAPGVVVATGFFRHGILLAPLAADVVAAVARRYGGHPDPADDDLLGLVRSADPRRFSASTPIHSKDAT